MAVQVMVHVSITRVYAKKPGMEWIVQLKNVLTIAQIEEYVVRVYAIVNLDSQEVNVKSSFVQVTVITTENVSKENANVMSDIKVNLVVTNIVMIIALVMDIASTINVSVMKNGLVSRAKKHLAQTIVAITEYA